MECKEAVSFMHQYLDGDLSKQEKSELQNHLLVCQDCRMRFKELERTETMLFGIQHPLPSVTDELTDRILSIMPTPKRQQRWVKWIKRHPAATAAAFFLVVVLSSLVSNWGQNSQLVVRGDHLDQLVIQGNTVIVPEGKAIDGDLTVENGTAQVYGDVEGNLTVIDGSYYQASTANISGQIKSIDRALDWVWYKISNLFTDVAYR
ncbi:zf-HC2 domain-containing protein [Paenibacillus sp. P96]|uniref:Anti-sigma-W factor RsiW n=1 Tax=Paenibacillus zeirhizosphaerae TaxID=2987519 RepID=A0ABT9FTW9_9BACL|nr:zf-HC2 domain-containing protein [Paenibacillus sp. P96]MDP4097946.1 zf-HC2 domain-containing protein [Paenibacillus sp. P96]